jgi:hypothetical protein
MASFFRPVVVSSHHLCTAPDRLSLLSADRQARSPLSFYHIGHKEHIEAHSAFPMCTYCELCVLCGNQIALRTFALRTSALISAPLLHIMAHSGVPMCTYCELCVLCGKQIAVLHSALRSINSSTFADNLQL